MLGDALLALTRTVRVFNCLTRPCLNTKASSHPYARTWCVIGTFFVDILALELVYFVTADLTNIIERGGVQRADDDQ